MSWAILGGLFLFALFFAYMSFKTWHLFHVLMYFAVFGATVFFLLVAAVAMKTHAQWNQQVQQLTEMLEEKQQENTRLRVGTPTDANLEEPTLLNLTGQLKRRYQQRGRVWRDAQLANATADSIELTLAEASGPPIPVGTTLTAFKEKVVSEVSEDWKVPVDYLGQFVVSNSAGQSVTVTPSLELDPERDKSQVDAINDPQGTWALYETMPLDGHDVFEGMSQEEIQAVLPQAELGIADSERYQQLIDLFRFNTQPVEEIREQVEDTARLEKLLGLDRDSSKQPTREWVRVRFLKDHTVDPNGELVPGADISMTPFDTSGRSQSSDLLQVDPSTGEPYPTNFAPGDEAVFDQATASQLTSGGDPVAEVQERLYFRELMDFDYSFRELSRQSLVIRTKIAAALRDKADIEASIADVQARITAADEELALLREDLSNHQQEVELASQHRQQLEQEWASLKQRIRELYFANKHYETQLASLHRQVAAEVERETRAAVDAVQAP